MMQVTISVVRFGRINTYIYAADSIESIIPNSNSQIHLNGLPVLCIPDIFLLLASMTMYILEDADASRGLSICTFFQ